MCLLAESRAERSFSLRSADSGTPIDADLHCVADCALAYLATQERSLLLTNVFVKSGVRVACHRIAARTEAVLNRPCS